MQITTTYKQTAENTLTYLPAVKLLLERFIYIFIHQTGSTK